jgi:hypothetical protein
MPESEVLRVRDLLPEGFARIQDEVRKDLQGEPGIAHAGVPGVLWPLIGDKAAAAVREALDADVVEILAGAWAKARELEKFKDEARYPPSAKVTLFLGEHALRAEIHPVLDITLGAGLHRKLRFTVELKAELQMGELTVHRAHVVAIGAGEGTVSAQLKYRELPLHEKLAPRPLHVKPCTLPEPGLKIP